MKILLVWFELPRRPELIEPFIKIAQNKDVEFIHLIHNSKKDREEVISPFRMIFWLDYNTPAALLNDIKPDKIISEFPTDLKGIALRVAAAKRKIPFIGMTHGIIFKNSADISLSNENSISSLGKYSKYFKIAFFYLSVIPFFKPAKAIKLLKYFFVFLSKGYYNAARTVKFSERNPDIYLVFQKKNAAKYYQNLSNIEEEKLIPIGVPMFDDIFYFFNEKNNIKAERYYLMIDTAWIYQTQLPSQELISNTYLKLAEFCKRNNAKLKVKLHPHWYDKDDLPQLTEIEYYRNVPQDNLNILMKEALGCFLYFSSLSVPLIVYKQCYFLGYRDLDAEIASWEKDQLIRTLDIENFSSEDINFNNFNERDPALINQFVSDYLFSTDGKSVERLGKIITA